MATLISAASGNLTAATTFALVDSASINPIRNTVTGNAYTTAVTTAAFTLGSVTVDGVLLFIKNQVAAPTGTLLIELLKSGTVQASCTVNKSDLSPFNNNAGINNLNPTFFKFGNTVAGDNTANWTLRLTGSSGSSSIYVATANSTTSNFSRMFRTTTLQAPAAGDNLFIVGEQTQGNLNSFTVTMDSTAATAYGSGVVNTTTAAGGGIHISKGGTLNWPTTASINSLLRINGDLWLWDGGVYQMGTQANPIPASSTAILEFQQTSASGDFGFVNYEGGSTTIIGSPRTANKPVYYAKTSGGGLVQGTTTNGSTTITSISDISKVSVGLTISGAGIPANATISSVNTSNNSIVINAAATASAALVGIRVYYPVGTKNFTIDTDTGWLSGDVIAIAPTGQSVAEGEVGVLTANAGTNSLSTQGWTAAATTLPISFAGTGGFLYNHDAGSYVPAEIALLTRNVKVRSTSNTLMSYVFIGNPNSIASFIAQWAEFYWVGANTGTKAGISLNGGPGTATYLQNCSIHDTLSMAFYANNFGSNNGGWNVQNNTFWNCGASSNPAVNMGSTTDASWTFQGNVCIRCISGTFLNLGDAGGSVTGNMISGINGNAINYAEFNGIIGACFGNVTHASGVGISMGSCGGLVNGNYAHRNANAGIVSSTALDFIIDSNITIGNGNAGLSLGQGANGYVKNHTASSDILFTQNQAFWTSNIGATSTVTFDNCDSGTPNFPYLPNNNDVLFQYIGANQKWLFRNCKFNATGQNIINGQWFLNYGNYVSLQRHNGIPKNHLTYSRFGLIQLDSVIFNTATPSERLSPTTAQSFSATLTNGSNLITSVTSFETLNVGTLLYNANLGTSYTITALDRVNRTVTLNNNVSASGTNYTFYVAGKLESSVKQIPVDSGTSAKISAMVRLSTASDGNAYNGNPPRLIIKANPALGISSDTVVGTFSGSAGTWTALSGTSPVVTDDGALEVLIDCDGTANRGSYLGWINIDDWSIA